MPDLNNTLNNIKIKSTEIENTLQRFLIDYDELYQEGNKVFNEERTASNGDMQGLEEFFMLLQTIKRNRDVIGSMVRGIKNLRPLNNFEIIEEDITKEEKKSKKRKSTEIIKENVDNFKIIEENAIKVPEGEHA